MTNKKNEDPAALEMYTLITSAVKNWNTLNPPMNWMEALCGFNKTLDNGQKDLPPEPEIEGLTDKQLKQLCMMFHLFKTHKELLETDDKYAKTYKSIDKSKGFG